MKKILLISGLFFLFSINSFAQVAEPTPQPSPQRVLRPPQLRDPTYDVNPGSNPDGLALRQMILQISVEPIYRKPTKEELNTISPSAGLRKQFSAFLKQENTGLFKLVVDSGCAGNPKIVSAKEKCLKFTMPGAGNSYSFRVNNYRIRHLADLTFSGNSFQVTGVLTHGILVNLGNVPLENVSLQTTGVKFLSEFQPEVDFEKAEEINRVLVAGIKKEGFLYSRALFAVENATYVLRSIAYNGKVMRSVRGIPYNELDFDNRKDITIAFRVVRSDSDGSLTILWKELSKKDSPKIRKKKIEQKKKVTGNKFVAENPVR
jgi:hypothetical protein